MQFNSNKQNVEANECTAINSLFSHCLQDILLTSALLLGTYATKADSRSCFDQQEEDGLFQQVACFPMLREYFKIHI
jgi:hypothetical protein